MLQKLHSHILIMLLGSVLEFWSNSSNCQCLWKRLPSYHNFFISPHKKLNMIVLLTCDYIIFHYPSKKMWGRLSRGTTCMKIKRASWREDKQTMPSCIVNGHDMVHEWVWFSLWLVSCRIEKNAGYHMFSDYWIALCFLYHKI